MSCSPTTGLTAGPATTHVLVLTTFDEAEHVYGALRAGASGIAVKDMTLNDILAAIRLVAAGDALIAPGVTRRLIADFVQRPVPAAERSRRPVAAITERKQGALTLVGRGRSNRLSLFAISTSLVSRARCPRCWTSSAPRTSMKPASVATPYGRGAHESYCGADRHGRGCTATPRDVPVLSWQLDLARSQEETHQP
ncbi:hypothetical protein AB0D12_33690 [Streptomyces sp. NPDC048479]|uniref:hypothetical protein n=1 Tax=Streptomyces sp. NPDC048479 TaxID=3154725 RepID=UPI00341541C3